MRVTGLSCSTERSRLTSLAFRLCVTLCLSATTLTIPRTIHAEEGAARIPQDGSWIRYQIESQVDGKEEEFDSTITISLVGTVTEDGILCRWLESRTTVRSPPQIEGTHISKVLVPQTDLLESGKPFENARRLWIRRREAPAMKFPLEKVANWINWEEAVLWTPGMLRSARVVENESKIIEHQSGDLKCTRAFSGELHYSSPGPNKLEIKFDRKFTVWPHPVLPLGFAEARIEGIRTLGEMKTQLVIIYHLQDFGTDAKSALPESD